MLFKKLENEVEEKAHEIEALKERVDLALSGNRDAVWDCSLVDDSGVNYVSERWQEMLGFSDKELPFNSFTDWKSRVHPDDLKKIMLDVEKNQNGQTEYYENIHREKHIEKALSRADKALYKAKDSGRNKVC